MAVSEYKALSSGQYVPSGSGPKWLLQDKSILNKQMQVTGRSTVKCSIYEFLSSMAHRAGGQVQIPSTSRDEVLTEELGQLDIGVPIIEENNNVEGNHCKKYVTSGPDLRCMLKVSLISPIVSRLCDCCCFKKLQP